MQLILTQEQELLRATISDFAKTEIAPLASKIDWEAQIPAELASKLPGLGLYGISTPIEYGGAGTDLTSLILAVEEISKVSGSLGMQIAVHNAIVCESLLASPNPDLKKSLLSKLASGVLGAFSFDPKSTVSCEMKGSDILVNGVSEYVVNAASAGVFVVLAKLNSGEKILFGFARESTDETFRTGPAKKLLGMRSSGTARIEFTDAKFPAGSLLCDAKATDNLLSRLLVKSRLAIAGVALGIAQASIDAAVKYSNERKQFNTKIGNFYAIQDFIATDEVSVQSSRSLTYSVSSDSASETLLRDSAVAKISASNAAVQAARHSIRVHGGYGFIRDYPVERYLRDARATQLLMESNETLKAEVAKSLMSLD